MQPTVIGRYQIVKPLGEGGMGTLWLGRDPGLDRAVVIKGLAPALVASAEMRERLLREARALGQLDHPHIVQVFDLVEHEGQWFICMQHVDGTTLAELLVQGPLSYEAILRIARGVASGLAAAWSRGIIHRDVKPGNVMVGADGQAKLLDFGIAWRPVDPSLTSTEVSLGTVHAMAPEQFSGQRPDHRSDLFSLGSMLYEMVTGRHPFVGQQAVEVIYAITSKAPDPPGSLRDDIPTEMLRILSKCLEKDPDLRYQHAAEVEADLRRLERELKGGAPDIEVTGQSRGALHRLRALGTGGRQRGIPAAPPRLNGRAHIALAAAGVLCVLALAITERARLGTPRDRPMTPSEADARVRELLGAHGLSVLGLHSTTNVVWDKKLRQYEGYLKLSPPERQQLERWRPSLYYQTVVASADRLERFRVRLHPSGRPIFLERVLRPDFTPETIGVDSASTLARSVLSRDLGLDSTDLEELPAAESVDGGRREREFRWRLMATLPGEATGTVSIRLAGAKLVRSEVTADIPPLAARAIDERMKNPVAAFLWTSLFLLLAIAVVVAARSRWLALPGLPLLVAMLVVTGFGSILGGLQGVQEILVEKGSYDAFGELTRNIVAFLVLTPLAWAAWGLVTGILGALYPRLMAGLGGASHLRLAPVSWALATAVALPLSALRAAFDGFMPWAMRAVGAAYWLPPVSKGLMFEPWFVLFGDLLTFPLTCVFSGLVASITVLFGRWTRLGDRVWLVLVLVYAVLSVHRGFGLQPPHLEYASAAVSAVLFVALMLRFGLLAAAIFLSLVDFYPALTATLSVPILSRQLAGAILLLAWLIALAVAVRHILRTLASDEVPETEILASVATEPARPST